MAVPKRMLIIDNGSYECRVGWHDTKQPELRFRNVLTKPRKDRKKDNQLPDASAPAATAEELKASAEIQIGNDITNIEAVRAHLKSPFERNVITNWNHQEQIFDYIFSKMGFDGEESIAHPIVLTEALANPNSCRRQMSELLFECYGVPALSYGIDALYSWQHHQQKHKLVADALIISFGYSTTHVIPVLANKMQLEHVRRLNVGGFHINNYLFRLMQMKYPVHLTAISSRIEKLVHEHCHIALDYKEELLKWAQLDYYENNIMKIQLPYNQVTATNALLTVEQKQEKRRELALRLLDIKNRREREKLQEDEEYLQVLRKLRQLYEQEKLQKFERALQQQQIANLEELDKLMGTLTSRIKRVKERAVGQLRPSKQQDKLDKMPKPPEGMPQAQWLSELRDKRKELLQRKQARQQQRQEQAKRHTHAAQERMRIISTLARSEKRRKANGGDEEDDGFGMNDNDWDVYKRINRYNDDSDSDAENEQMLEYEKILQHYDAGFDDANNAAMQALIAAENYQLHFGVEAIRVPEILFQPSMIGCTEAGLAELIAFVLKLFTAEQQQRLVDHVYLTGSCAQFRGLKERLAKELLELRPFQSSFAIYESNDPTLSAWLGACLQANSKNFSGSLTTRKLYQEYGGEYFREHSASNLYYPTPKD
ncbi:actin-related protein 5 [Drosophila novamexicana]|uniref:actin-related protein 5 n=1 Tax=Drosophila novamexicana TaxID=47314 RepID=UPI0011E5F7AF|nr:actin-related protein 5 [Drosophila novamexicana]